jgi:cytochrome d ubiquinol oxidase subunit I
VLSFLAFGRFNAEVKGLNDIPEREWPDQIELLYYSFHVMVGLGTMFIGLMGLAVLLRWRGWLEKTRPLLWVLMLAFPFPYIANTAGWMTAELGRQPWLVYGLLRTLEGASPTVHAGSTLFTLIGFCGLYLVLGLTFLVLLGREVLQGPEAAHA